MSSDRSGSARKVTRWARSTSIDREEYAELEVDAKVALIRSWVPLGLMHIEELLDEEVTALAGERDARNAPSVGGRRHGSNPGTVGLAGQLSKSGKRAIGRVGRAPSHAATSNKLLMN